MRNRAEVGRRLDRRVVALASAGLLLVLTAERCSGDRADCNTEPTGTFSVFLGGAAPASPVHLAGRIIARTGVNGDGFRSLTLSDGAGVPHVVFYQSPGDSLPLAPGDSCAIDVEVVGGAPPVSALTIHDAQGLLFVGACDQLPGAHVLKAGVPGVTLELRATGCPSRAHGDCYRGVYNQDLAVTLGGETKLLGQGQAATLGGFRFTCLTAQRVDYAPGCADAGLYGLSWTMVRVSTPAAR